MCCVQWTWVFLSEILLFHLEFTKCYQNTTKRTCVPKQNNVIGVFSFEQFYVHLQMYVFDIATNLSFSASMSPKMMLSICMRLEYTEYHISSRWKIDKIIKILEKSISKLLMKKILYITSSWRKSRFRLTQTYHFLFDTKCFLYGERKMRTVSSQFAFNSIFHVVCQFKTFVSSLVLFSVFFLWILNSLQS